jgi:hypothetical protein
MNYIVNWALSGFRDAEHKAGDIIEAVEHEAEQIADLVKAGVLTLINGANRVPFDPLPASPDELVAYAKSKFDFDLDPSLSKDAMLAEIASLQAGTGDEDTGSGSETAVADMTKAQLVEFAKSTFGFVLKPALSKDAMLAEIASLQAKG